MSEIKTGCEYQVLDNGIHEFVLLDFSRAGVDTFVEAVEQMNKAIPPGAPRPILVDSSGGVLPLNYAFSRMRTMSTATATGNTPSKTAILMQPGVMIGIVGGMMRIFPLLRVRFFRPGERQAAIDWLLEG
jgi:hypothetical protein